MEDAAHGEQLVLKTRESVMNWLGVGSFIFLKIWSCGGNVYTQHSEKVSLEKSMRVQIPPGSQICSDEGSWQSLFDLKSKDSWDRSPLAVQKKLNKMEIQKEAWNKFIEIIDFESNDSNFKISFKDITKKYGNAYIENCKAAWFANCGIQTEEEFMKMNGDMPRSFFDMIKKKSIEEYGNESMVE
jgi:hypothetical protein